ncbi:MAG: DNA polymerase III subunit alpha [Planctomycetota bacterium]
MPDKPFVHLHCHSHYSLLDGAAPLDRLIQRAKSHGMNALAITDHGNLHGALEFYQKARKADLNPIVGYEAYIAPQSRHSREPGSLKESSYHLTLLAQNRQGFDNLLKLASLAFLEGFYRKPRIDKEALEQYSEGIVCLSGCVSGELSRTLLRNRGGEDPWTEAAEIAGWFHRVFGDRYFIEIQNNGVEIQRQALEASVEIANRLGLPLVATGDTHYVDREDAEAQDVLLCINTGRYRTDASRMKMEGNNFYLKSPQEMYEAFPGLHDAVARSQEIADGIDIELDLGKRHFPSFAVPPEQSADDFLRSLCLRGLHDRYQDDDEMRPDGELSQVVLDRLDRELGVIGKLGFANYFLICWDFVRQARELNIPATARGSGVGALVSYALHLSHVCPIKYDLLFERFLDPSRAEAPDIDIDFCKERRGEIIRYVKEKYGAENVAQIGTFGTLAARAAIRDVGRALGIPLARVNQVVKMVPEKLGITLENALKESDELKATYDSDGEVRELLDLAQKIEGLARNVGTHAAAVVIADQPLTEYVPLGKVTGKTDIITQWSMNDVEAAGLLKMDFLGLRNLTILSKAVEIIEQTRGEKVDPHQFSLEDPKTFALLQRGETKGIFQLESGGIRDLLQKMKPDHFGDIIATNALYRPGPLEGGMVQQYIDVKHGRKKAEYQHPVLEEVLTETHGVMVYQEQVMRILNRLGDIPLASAYTCIKAISKKKEAIIAANFEQFIEGSVANGLDKKKANALWEMILKFAGYGFNKSHSTAYALIAYQTAYLKTHYPLEFMAALLSGDIPGRNFSRKDSLVEHLEDCRKRDIEVAPPDVNHSDVDFSVVDGRIHFGLSAIKGCGGGAAEAVVKARREGGPFVDIFDFCERVESSACPRSTIETLIKAGAFDSLNARRSQLSAVIERAVQAGAAAAADRRSGQMNLFGGAEEDTEEAPAAAALPDLPEWEERERLLMEKEVLGFYLSSHPLSEYEKELATYCTHQTSQLDELREKTEVFVGGMLSSLRLAHVKKAKENGNTKYAMFDLEDMHGAVRCILWPEDYAKYGELVQHDAILVARASVDRGRGGDEVNLVVNELIPLDELGSRYTHGVQIHVHEPEHDAQTLKKLHEITRAYPGNCELQLVLNLADGQRVAMKSNKLRVDVQHEFKDRVEELLSPGHFRLLTSGPKASTPKAKPHR